MTVRLRDVAGLAGVSVATASRALNRDAASQVGGPTRERVWDAARSLGYVVRGDAWLGSREPADGGVRRQSVGLILDDVDDLFVFPFWVRVLAGIKKELLVRRCQALFSYTASDSRREHVQQFPDVDGLIYVNTRPLDHDMPARPTVTIDGNYRAYVRNGLRFDHIGIDMRSAMYEMVDHLLGLGRRRFGYLGPAIAADERTEAVHQGLALRGCSLVPGCDPVTRWTTDAAYAVARGLLVERAADLDTLICASDEIAIGAMRAAKELGLRLPDDLAITGFNDEPFARDLDPALTSLRVPKELMGELAARRLVQCIRTPNLAPIIQLVPASLVVRASCGAKTLQPPGGAIPALAAAAPA